MRILLTGGAGYIGSHTSLALLDNGHEVTIIDNLSTGNRNLVPVKANFIECSIEDKATITSILKKNKFDILMHFAGYIKVDESISYPEKYFKNNTDNTIILFDTCLKNNLKNIVFSSTAATYGNPINEKPVSEDSLLKPLNPYGQSKIQVEKYLQNNSKLKHIILRYFNVAGADPKMRSGLINKETTHLIKMAAEVVVGKRNEITIYGNDYPTPDGTAIRDYIHVSDLADIHLKAADYLLKKKKSETINCGYGKGFSVKEVMATIKKLSDKEITIMEGARRPGDSYMLVSNTSKLKNILQWNPQYNDLSFIIKTAIDWEKKLLLKDYV